GRKLIRTIPDSSENRGTFPCYAFSADGKYALLGNYRSPLLGDAGKLDPDTFTFWDLQTGCKLRSFATNGEEVYQVALSPNGKWALSVNICKRVIPDDGKRLPYALRAVRLWDTATGKIIRTLVEEC